MADLIYQKKKYLASKKYHAYHNYIQQTLIEQTTARLLYKRKWII